MDVDECIGTLGLMTASHRARWIHHDDLRAGAFGGQVTHSGDPEMRARLTAAILAENRAGGGHEEVRVVAPRGSAVVFDGHLFHRGVMGADPTAMRHVLATHYVPRGLGGRRRRQQPRRTRRSEGGREADVEWPHVLCAAAAAASALPSPPLPRIRFVVGGACCARLLLHRNAAVKHSA